MKAALTHLSRQLLFNCLLIAVSVMLYGRLSNTLAPFAAVLRS